MPWSIGHVEGEPRVQGRVTADDVDEDERLLTLAGEEVSRASIEKLQRLTAPRDSLGEHVVAFGHDRLDVEPRGSPGATTPPTIRRSRVSLMVSDFSPM